MPQRQWKPKTVIQAWSRWRHPHLNRNPMSLLGLQLPILLATLLVFNSVGQSEELEIKKRWQGDLPVAAINLLPVELRESEVGYLSDAESFQVIWRAFAPERAVPEFDPESELVVYVRNVRFYNRMQLTKCDLDSGCLTLQVATSRAALPIRETVRFVMVIVPKDSITKIAKGGASVEVQSPQP